MEATKENILSCLSELKPILRERGVEKLALFGSYARGEESLYSDIDIAIGKMEDSLDKGVYGYFELRNFIKSKIWERFGKRGDVFDLDSDSPFKSSIEKELIYV